jgi:ribonucleoside-diphosphate reductase alpha chain
MTYNNTFGTFAQSQIDDKYAHDLGNGLKEDWRGIAWRTATEVLRAVNAPYSQIRATAELIENRVFIPGGRYLYAAGRPKHQTQNCLLMRAGDSSEEWGNLLDRVMRGLMTGAGIGVEYSNVRAEGSPLKTRGGFAGGPISLMEAVNDVARPVRQGGARRAALWAGLNWQHPDVFKFITRKNWSEEIRALKAKDFNFPAPLDGTNISVGLDDAFFKYYLEEWESEEDNNKAEDVYWSVIRQMLTTAEPGFKISLGDKAANILSNACTEIDSADDDDICNLGSLNMARINSTEEMTRAVELATKFLLAGTVYSDVPYPEVAKTRAKNRRLGLGLMGVHEFLLKRGEKYGVPDMAKMRYWVDGGEHLPKTALTPYLEIYAQSGLVANEYADQLKLSRPVATRAIAPNGTIGIVAETTTGMEPLFCAAYKRRYRDGNGYKYQYVIDPISKRLVEEGVNPKNIEDAYSLAVDPERRVAFQAYLQHYVDHSISSTINLPAWGSQYNNESTVKPFGEMLMKYLPKLRGITTYPDGCRPGQPLNAVSYEEALESEGRIFSEEQQDVCSLTKGGSCGS